MGSTVKRSRKESNLRLAGWSPLPWPGELKRLSDATESARALVQALSYQRTSATSEGPEAAEAPSVAAEPSDAGTVRANPHPGISAAALIDSTWNAGVALPPLRQPEQQQMRLLDEVAVQNLAPEPIQERAADLQMWADLELGLAIRKGQSPVQDDEVWDLFRRTKDLDARSWLLNANLGLLSEIANEVAPRLPNVATPDELRSFGFLGLVSAVENYDPDGGVPFPRYAKLRIRGSVIDELRAMDWAPRSVRARSRELDRIRETLQQSLNRVPTEQEVAVEAGTDVQGLRRLEVLSSRARLESLDTMLAVRAERATPPESSDETASEVPQRALVELREAIESLPPLEKAVLVLEFFEGKSADDIAGHIGSSGVAVSRLRTSALNRLRGRMNRLGGPGELRMP